MSCLVFKIISIKMPKRHWFFCNIFEKFLGFVAIFWVAVNFRVNYWWTALFHMCLFHLNQITFVYFWHRLLSKMIWSQKRHLAKKYLEFFKASFIFGLATVWTSGISIAAVYGFRNPFGWLFGMCNATGLQLHNNPEVLASNSNEFLMREEELRLDLQLT